MSRPAAERWLLLAALASGCAPPADAGSPEGAAPVVVGVTSDLAPGKELHRFRLVARVDDALVADLTRSSADERPLAFPLEVPVDAPEGARVDVLLEAYGPLGEARPFLTRAAATTAVAGRSLLLRARLEQVCIPEYRLAGDHNTPTCEPPETCVSAACRDPYVPPEKLDDYRADWATEFADACKPLGAGPAEVELGQGLDAFAPLEEGAAVQVEAGPQGGFHLWLAVRTRNLHQTGSITVLRADGAAVDPTIGEAQLPFGYVAADDGWCELYGLRQELFYGVGAADMAAGSEVRLRARVVDVTGDVAFDEKVITVAAPW